MTLCKAVIMGTVVRNPEKRFTTNNVPITTFAMNISNDDEETLLRVIVMGKQAEVAAEKVTKDKTVIVEGRLQTGVAKSTSGEEKKIVEINAQSVEVIGSSVSTSSKNDNEEILKFQDEDFGDDLIGEDEIPF
jgi:single-strand DNA-binding protein